MTTPLAAPLSTTRPGRPVVSGLAWTGVTALASVVVALLAVELVGPRVKAGGVPASVATLSDLWWAGYLVVAPVLLAARRSLLMALPAVAVAAVPQFWAATVGLDRIAADDGLEALIYLVPLMMTGLFLTGAVIGAVLRVLELRRTP
jgi:hypothetical protein